MNKLLLKRKLDNSIYNIYNLLSRTLFFSYKNRRLVKRNYLFKNIHLGKRCFILGTGPSLNNVNLNLLKDEITFGVNYLFKSEIAKNLNPNYYCLYDNKFYTENKEVTKEIIKRYPDTTFFLPTNAYNNMNEKNSNNNIYYQHCKQVQYASFIAIDMVKNMTAPFNVINSCIQIAMYMGFKEIYLLGCDFNSFATQKVYHCYDTDNLEVRNRTLGDELKEYSMVCNHHYALDKYAKKNNIKIYNITENSLLDSYERKDFKNIL